MKLNMVRFRVWVAINVVYDRQFLSRGESKEWLSIVYDQ